MSEDFKIGDVVTLKSGGPAMTVTYSSRDEVLARWFVGETERNDSFHPACLERLGEERAGR